MTKVVFETAALAEALKKAGRVAPSRGAAYDKASGIVMQVAASLEGRVVIRATDTSVFHVEWVEAQEVEGEDATWRVPSKLLVELVATLPIGSGKTVTLEDVRGEHSHHIVMKSGRTKSKLNMMDPAYYPMWDSFSPDNLGLIKDFGARLSQVEWAAATTGGAPFAGVIFRGGYLLATDRYRFAVAPMEYPEELEDTIVPSGMLSSLLLQTGDVYVGRIDNQFAIMPNDFTQIKTVTYEPGEYPNILPGLQNINFTHHVSFPKADFLALAARANIFAGSDRTPTLAVIVGEGEVAVKMDDSELGMFGDSVPVDNQADHAPLTIHFNPKILTQGLNAAPSAEVTLHYALEGHNKVVKLDGGSGCEYWVSTKKGPSNETE